MSSANKKAKIDGIGNPNPEDLKSFDKELRPDNFVDYVGQENIKENLSILLTAAKQRNHPPEHLLFYGPPGLGKTTLAHLVAKETGAPVRATSGPAIERVADLASVLTNLTPGEILFIDEIHRLNKTIEEVLYPAMESGSLDIIIGKGPSARTIELPLPPFTLIGATTRIAMVSSPLRSRFSGGVFRLDFYTEDEIAKIVRRSARILGVKLGDEGSMAIAKRSRFTPRTANFLLKRARDFGQVKEKDLSEDTINEAFVMLGVDDMGLFPSDRMFLSHLIEKFSGGPVGLSTLAAALSEDEDTIEEFNEPYLLQIGFIERTPRGRQTTKRAEEHMKKHGVKSKTNKLL
jgi:Holliday junction DNA helicase RuvB